MKRTKKALASLAIAGMALTMVPFNAFAEGTFPTRLAGWTAVQTATAIADQTGWTGTAILASSASYGMVDALTAGPLANFIKAPILLQGAENTLNVDTKAELIKLNITKVYVTSGTAVISQGVIDELKGMNITVESLGGFDRFATSANIAQKMVALGATVSKAAVVYGWLNPDALSIASIASAQTEPILLTDKDAIPASVKAFLTTNTSVVTTDVIGGTAVIDEVVKAQLPSATRVAGITAYDTNVAVLKAFDAVLKYDHVFIANGETAIDALTGAPLAAKYNAGIVLTNGTANEGMTYVMSKLSSTSVVTAFGGTAVVPDSVLAGVVYVAPAGGGGSSSGGGGGYTNPVVTPTEAFIDQVMDVYASLDPSEKGSLQTARDNLNDLLTTDAVWDSAEFTALNNSKVEAKGVTKEDLIKLNTDLSAVHYSADEATLKANLNTFKVENSDTFEKLFGNDFTMDQFYGFLTATQAEIPSAIVKGDLTASLKSQIIEATKVAMHSVVDPTENNEYHIFATKLSDLDWSIDKLVDAQSKLGSVIDPDNLAETAIARAAIASLF